LCRPAPTDKVGALYGESNGYGWKEKEIVGAQVVSVPMSLPIRNANKAFITFMGSLAAIFVVTFIVLNVMLSVMIIRPIALMSESADRISTGDRISGAGSPEPSAPDASVQVTSLGEPGVVKFAGMGLLGCLLW
jgi:methyl-accepting chemotaxis protein